LKTHGEVPFESLMTALSKALFLPRIDAQSGCLLATDY
jgi:hypothetical protein